jgi:putative Mn2+ efflux pump MntP
MLKSVINKIKHNHYLLMVLCCTLPILGFFILPLLGFSDSVAYYALFLLCPIGHIYMMKGMHKKSCEHHKTEEPKQIEFKHYKANLIF